MRQTSLLTGQMEAMVVGLPAALPSRIVTSPEQHKTNQASPVA